MFHFSGPPPLKQISNNHAYPLRRASSLVSILDLKIAVLTPAGKRKSFFQDLLKAPADPFQPAPRTFQVRRQSTAQNLKELSLLPLCQPCQLAVKRSSSVQPSFLRHADSIRF